MRLLSTFLLPASCLLSQVLAASPVLRARDGRVLSSFAHKPSYETFGKGLTQPPSFQAQSLEDSAKTFVQQRLSLGSDDVHYRDGFTNDLGVRNVYLTQQKNGVPFANAVANVAFKGNTVVAFGHNFINTTSIASPTPSISPEAAIKAAEDAFSGINTRSGVPVLEYLVKQDATVVLTYAVHVSNKEEGTAYQAFVDAHSGEVVSGVDFRSDATYKAIRITNQSPNDGFELITDPQDLSASPFGWHSTDATTITNDTSQVPVSTVNFIQETT
jgi:extracellular elastinolytic metalloproteinase